MNSRTIRPVCVVAELPIPYSASHRDQTRKRIVESARRLFNRYGFDGVSIKQIMSGAGLTHGGFYGHFGGKSDLYREVLGCFFTDPEWKNRWKGVEVDPGAADFGPQIIRAYLSRQHLADIENSCPMVALPTDVRRSGRDVKAAFEGVFRAMVTALERGVGLPGAAGHARAQAIAALCVGGVLIARAVRDEAYAEELRAACLQVALESGDWGGDGKVSTGSRQKVSVVSRSRPKAKRSFARPIAARD